MYHIIATLKVEKEFNHLLTDEEFGKNFLILWAIANDMNIIGKPAFHKFQSQLEKTDLEGGYSGIILLSESHASIHTYPEKDIAYMDLFSCRHIDEYKNEQFITKRFKVKDVENFKFEVINR